MVEEEDYEEGDVGPGHYIIEEREERNSQLDLRIERRYHCHPATSPHFKTVDI